MPLGQAAAVMLEVESAAGNALNFKLLGLYWSCLRALAVVGVVAEAVLQLD